MKPIHFEASNIIIGEGQEGVNPLPAFHDSNLGAVITCWELTEEEINIITETKRLYLSQRTFNTPLQPVFLTPNINEVIAFKEDANSINFIECKFGDNAVIQMEQIFQLVQQGETAVLQTENLDNWVKRFEELYSLGLHCEKIAPERYMIKLNGNGK